MSEAKKPAPKKAAASKTAAKRTTPKKPTSKRPGTKKAAAGKTPNRARKTAAKTASKTTTARKPAARKRTAAKTQKPALGLSEYTDQAAAKAKSIAGDGKSRATEAAGNIGQMIHDTADALDDSIGEKYGDYIRSAANTVNDFAEKVDAKEIDDIVDDARNFVKKRPAVAIGAAAAVGFVLVRLIKSGMDDKA